MFADAAVQDTLKLIYEDDSTTYLDEAAILIECLGTSRKLDTEPRNRNGTLPPPCPQVAPKIHFFSRVRMHARKTYMPARVCVFVSSS